MTSLDRLLRVWSERPVHTGLAQMEPRVWARIEAGNRAPVAGMLGFRAALIASMMVVGIVAGGVVSATAEPDASPFSAHSLYAPSTLLEVGR